MWTIVWTIVCSCSKSFSIWHADAWWNTWIENTNTLQIQVAQGIPLLSVCVHCIVLHLKSYIYSPCKLFCLQHLQKLFLINCIVCLADSFGAAFILITPTKVCFAAQTDHAFTLPLNFKESWGPLIKFLLFDAAFFRLPEVTTSLHLYKSLLVLTTSFSR